MSKKAVRKMAREQKDMLVSLRQNLKEAMAIIDRQKGSLGVYIRFGQDLYLTSNVWLFTEETKVDPAKAARAIELLLLCRKYYEGIIKAYMDLNAINEDCRKALATLKEGKLDDTFQAWMGEILPKTSAIGEQVATVVIGLTPVKEERLDSIVAAMPPMAAFLESTIKQAQANIDALKEGNLQNIDPKEEAKQNAAIEEAIAATERAAGVAGETIPVMPENAVSDDEYKDLNVPESALHDPTNPVEVIHRLNEPEGVLTDSVPTNGNEESSGS